MSSNGKVDFKEKRRRTAVYVPELDHTFHLTALKVEHLELMQTDTPSQRSMRHLAFAIVDENDNPIYTMDEVKEMSITVFGVLSAALDRLHGSDGPSAEQTIKNSEASASTDSASA